MKSLKLKTTHKKRAYVVTFLVFFTMLLGGLVLLRYVLSTQPDSIDEPSKVLIDKPNSFYVTPLGNGLACTKTSPCSLYTALSQVMQKGGEMIIGDGVYANVTSNYSSDSNTNTSGRPVTIRSENRYGAKIIFAEKERYGWYFSGTDITIKGLEITAPDSIGAIVFSDSQRAKVEGLLLHDIGTKQCRIGSAISFVQTSFNSSKGRQEVSGSIVYRVGKIDGTCTATNAIQSSVQDTAIYNSIISAVSGSCVLLEKDVEKVLIANNAIDHCSLDAITLGTKLKGTQNSSIAGLVANNTIRDSNAFCIKESGAIARIVYLANNCWKNINNTISTLQRTINVAKVDNGIDALTYYESPEYSEYPDVTSPIEAGADYHLLPTSKLKNHGVETTVSVDFDGVLRPRNGAVDIGPYEQ